MIILSLAGFFAIQAQEIQIKGVVTDTINKKLQNANVLAIPFEKNYNLKFAITDNEGNYQLELNGQVAYSIEVSYLGYQTFKDSINLNANKILNIKLIPSQETLEEIVITERIPIKVKEDTIVYRPEKFLTGEERKLKDVLKKLPGIGVDREGNVTVNGKQVTKLLVDGKEFFTGDEKLGVNNIPFNVIDEVVALDHYNEVSFLKGLSDSEELALNIKLKKGKKKFAFGELEAGAGINDRYTLNPTTFYFSPKTTINLIGDFNNTGQKQFTISDYINFDGGISSLEEDPQSFFKLFNDDFAQFLAQEDFIFNRNNFGALSLNQNLTKNLDFSGYSIISSGDLRSQIENNITYLNNNVIENRINTQQNKLNFSINKATFRHKNLNDLDLKYDAVLKTNNGSAENNITSKIIQDTSVVNQINNSTLLEFTQKVALNKKFSKRQTSSLNSSYRYLNSSENNFREFNNAIFSSIIPITANENNFNLFQNNTNKLREFKINLKHYWVLSNHHHIYPEIGINRLDEKFTTLDGITLPNQTIDFQDNGFNNLINYKLTQTFFGAEYKAKVGKFVIKPGIFYKYFDWKIEQFNELQRNTGTGELLPSLQVNWDINSSEKVKLNYNRYSSFGYASQFANRFSLQNFNLLFFGNSNLENELYQRCSVIYSKFNPLKGNFFNATIKYTYREKSIRPVTSIENIDQTTTLIYTDLPENFIDFNFLFSKLLGNYKFNLGVASNYNNYSRIINNQTLDFTLFSNSYQITNSLQLKKGPNIKLDFVQQFNEFKSEENTNNFVSVNPSLQIEYSFFKDLLLNVNYNFTYFKNITNNNANRFSIGNFTLSYNKENSPWAIGLEGTNIFNTRFKRESSTNQFTFNDNLIFIQPRIYLLKLAYKF